MYHFALREKLMKLDAKRCEYQVCVIGEEPHPAYNRVGLTSFFQHREVERLYLKPQEWVCIPACRLHSVIQLTSSVHQLTRELAQFPSQYEGHRYQCRGKDGDYISGRHSPVRRAGPRDRLRCSPSRKHARL